MGLGLSRWWKKKCKGKTSVGVPLINYEFAKRYAGCGYKIGTGTYGTPIVHDWHEGTTLTIGAYGSIADDVHIYLGGNHQTNWATTYPFYSFLPEMRDIDRPLKTRGDVTIGNDVWLGSGCRILSGVTISDGAVVAAGSVVTKDVAPFEIIGGNPARHIRYRFDEDGRALLLHLCWWAWPTEVVLKAAPLLCSGNLKELEKWAISHTYLCK